MTRTQEWLRDHAAREQPLCLYVGLVAPHFPLVVPEEFYDLYPEYILPPVEQLPNDGHPRHPWIKKQNAFMDSEALFKHPTERVAAMWAYQGLCTWLDDNVDQILTNLEEVGLTDDTTIVYTSDHGDNVGARGLWGKSNTHEERAAIPMIVAGPQVPCGDCAKLVSF